jgi:surface antigen
MIRTVLLLPALLLLAALPAQADARPVAPDPAASTADESVSPGAPPAIQCVPYARQVSGIRIYGDAHTWWAQAASRYARGTRPRVNAVMAFEPHGAMQLGHVAVVSRIIDRRTVLLRHANWSLIGGRRGQLEDNVRAVDVSPNNDWSAVRVWYAPLGDLGTTHWPLRGFIYNRPPSANERLTVLASAATGETSGHNSLIGPDFLDGLAAGTPAVRRAGLPAKRQSPAAADPRPGAQDPIGRIIYSRLR